MARGGDSIVRGSFAGFRSTLVLVPLLLVWALVLSVASPAQTETATLSGTVMDPAGAVVAAAEVRVTSADTNLAVVSRTNASGLYVLTGLKPGRYRIVVTKEGFKQTTLTDLTLNVQDVVSRNLVLEVGSTSETITVEANAELISTAGSVGTVVDRQFVENIPANGRSFQTLIELAPGVVMVPVTSTGSDQGQFSVNGQRNNANYFTVDGVSVNFGIPVFQGLYQGTSGSIPGTNIQGGFSNLASVDALQEFRIQTSTFAPEFGRSPGAQISLVTRSGQNDLHGSAYDYLRNDVFDAKDWFDLRKPPLRFNDFGTTLGGPIRHNKDFFFFSYEGQRYLLPQPTITTVVPSQAVRANAPNSIAKMLLDAFPIPNGAPVGPDGAYFKQTYSNPNNAEAYSIRIDHNFSSKYRLFGRFNTSPSNALSRSSSDFSEASKFVQNTAMLTLGSTQTLTNQMVNELYVNASRQQGQWLYIFDGLGGGARPDPTVFLPPGYADSGARYYLYYIYSLTASDANLGGVSDGEIAKNEARSINAVDNLSLVRGTHQLKFGFDYRWFSPIQPGNSLIVGNYFLNGVSDVYNLTAPRRLVSRSPKTVIVTPNYSSYAQDTWTISPRLTLTYGLRWEINPAPHAKGGKELVTLVTPPDLNSLDQSGLQLAPIGTPYYPTSYTDFAPRVGVAYQLRPHPRRELVLRGGWGMFYDLASTPFAGGSWPYTYSATLLNQSVPVTADAIPLPAPNFTPSPTNRASGIAVAPHGFTLPRTYQWNLTLEQALGTSQSLSVAYVGSSGRDLLRALTVSMGVAPGMATATMPAPNPIYWSPNFASLVVVTNQSSSDYHSMQMQYNRRLSRGLQALVNYTWSHSIDDSSSGSSVNSPGYFFQPNQNHGDSDFDVRHNFSAAATYQIPTPHWNKAANSILRDWSLSTIWLARTGLPFDVKFNESTAFSTGAFRRADVTGAPLTVSDPTVAGGWRLNAAAFSMPGAGTQGTMGRNSLHEFPAWQADFALHRNFKITERFRTEFRFESFNIFNHPNFHFYYRDLNLGSSNGQLVVPAMWGKVSQTLARAYGGGSNTGGFNPLFQNGGPRSMQFALRFQF